MTNYVGLYRRLALNVSFNCALLRGSVVDNLYMIIIIAQLCYAMCLYSNHLCAGRVKFVF